MAISFQNVGIEPGAGFALPEKGPYTAKITKAEFKYPADATKNPYLNIQYEIFNEKNEKKGIIFDMLSTSDAPFTVKAMNRFMTVLGLAGKEFPSYEAICKILPEKRLGFFIVADNSDYVKQNPDKARMIVNKFTDGMFYTVEEIKEHMPNFTATAPATENTQSDTNGSAPFDVDSDF